MSLFSSKLAELIRDYLKIKVNVESETRLLIPAPTENIGYKLQVCLQEMLPDNIPVYLIVNPNIDLPNKNKKWLFAEGITSYRKGNFVVIVQPGCLSRIEESMKSATIIGFSDEWPWILQGELPKLSFKKELLPKLSETWFGDQSEWITALLNDYIVKALAGSRERNKILFDDIIDGFDPNCESSLNSIKDKFLFHAGIPSIDILDPKDALENCVKISKKIDVQSRQLLLEEQKDAQDEMFINIIYDGWGALASNYSEILSLRKVFKTLKEEEWKALTIEKLLKLFNIKDMGYQLTAGFAPYEDDYRDIFITKDESFMVAKVNANFNIRCSWNLGIQDSESNCSKLKLEIKQGRKILRDQPISPTEAKEKEFDFCVSDDHLFGEKNNGKEKKITVSITASNERVVSKTLTIRMLNEEFSELVIIDEPLKAFRYDKEDEQAELDICKLEFASKIIVLSVNEERIDKLMAAEDELAVENCHNSGIAQISKDRVDPSSYPEGKIEIIAKFANKHEISVELEAQEKKQGYPSLEDALVKELIKSKDPARNKELQEIHNLFSGDRQTPYLNLGHTTNSNAFRISLSKRMEGPRGANPIILSLEHNSHQELDELSDIVVSKKLNKDEFTSNHSDNDMPEAISLIQSYHKERNSLICFYKEYLNEESKHPLYASTPTYIENKATDIEKLVEKYLEIYKKIIDFLEDNSLSKIMEFQLTYLDCAVMVEKTSNQNPTKHNLFLIGPWHPLQVANRFQRQKTKFYSTDYCLQDQHGINKFAGILEDLLGIRAFHSHRGHHDFGHAYVSDTSDTGWSIALKTEQGDEPANFTQYSTEINRIFDLKISAVQFSPPALTASYIKSFLDANPSERRLEIYIRKGLDTREILSSVSDLIYVKGFGKQLPGGVHIYFEELEEETLEDIEWDEPPICVYHAPQENECLKDNHIDILVVAPNLGFKAKSIKKSKFRPIASGDDTNATMMLVLPKLVDGSQGMQNSRYQETNYCDGPESVKPGIRGSVTEAYLSVVRKIPDLVVNTGLEIEREVNLPKELDASWVILPSNSIDPAILSHHINSTDHGRDHQRVLWEYQVDLAASQSDYFILSEIAQGFEQAIATSIFKNFDKQAIIRDLSKVGVAIGGESLRTGMKALGVLGQVGAIRLFSSENGNGPLRNSVTQMGIILPVDSFESVLGSTGTGSSSKKSDLLAIQITLDDKSLSRHLTISATSIEAKFASKTYGDTASAFDQAKQTFDRFKLLVTGSKDPSGFIQRLLLGKLIRYGMQLSFEGNEKNLENRNFYILDSILKGQIKWLDPEYTAIVCSTEGNLSNTQRQSISEGRLWIRLSPQEWPGENDQSINLCKLKSKLQKIFPGSSMQPEVNEDVVDKPEVDKPEVDEDVVDSDVEDKPVVEINQMQRIPREKLEGQYARLLGLLSNNKIIAFEPDDGDDHIIEGPASILFRLNLEDGEKPKKLADLADQFHIAFKLEQDQKVRIYSHIGSVYIDIPKQEKDRYFIDAATDLWKKWKRPAEGLTVPLGVDQYKKIVEFSFSNSSSPHLLVGGTTGGGKSEALYTILSGLLKYYNPDELKLILIDPKQVELNNFAQGSYKKYLLESDPPIGYTTPHAIQSLEECIEEMARRQNILSEASNSGRYSGDIKDITSYNKAVENESRLPWWLIVMDEYYDLISDNENKKNLENQIKKLASKARAVGIHIIITTQQPTVEVVSTVIRANLPAQLALKVNRHTNSTVIMGETGAECLNEKGDAYLKVGAKLRRLQIAIVNR